ncbi:hypothetical protein BV25DRAFT_1819916 [Artomyces pyxidatus]|uniref:Uncharacterized protein n=2 Tax=Artomyces pyxidatus TaxID=48021 RepID=A0ACB8SG94_9AGAM|nr:hypothetical protein BV25DRAFT_1833538 [Artomyces pyxidatus]KAI0066810.1 hypothetical protein BV25DRAFT_1819916 [Artomyces pyxidatus]
MANTSVLAMNGAAGDNGPSSCEQRAPRHTEVPCGGSSFMMDFRTSMFASLDEIFYLLAQQRTIAKKQ